MQREVKLTPVELYFLGKRMGARYIDYQYIAAMPGIQDSYVSREQETIRTLEERGFLMEDFSGDVEIDDDIKETLAPIFFGRTESVVQAEQPHRFHVYDGKVAHTVMDAEYITINLVEDAGIAQILTGFEDDAVILCAKVEEGMQKETFTDLKNHKKVQKAIRFIKGEA